MLQLQPFGPGVVNVSKVVLRSARGTKGRAERGMVSHRGLSSDKKTCVTHVVTKRITTAISCLVHNVCIYLWLKTLS